MTPKNMTGYSHYESARLMKNLFWIAALALLTCACSVEEPFDAARNDKYPAEVYARIENDATSDTRAYVDAALKVLWENDDRISLFNKYTYNKEYRFTGETGANAGVFTEANSGEIVTGNELDNVYAIYPYQESTAISNDGVITLNLPAVQSYKENSFGRGANTMVSATAGTDLLFKNLCGYLILKLYGDEVSVSSITLQGNNGELLAGVADVTAAVGSIPSLSFRASGTYDTLVLNCEVPVELGATAEDATVFWLVVPPTVFTKGFTLTVTDSDGNTFEKVSTSSKEIKRNSTFRVKALEVEINKATVPVPEAIDMGLSVKWAAYNLGASSAEGLGEYYAWGELQPKQRYYWDTYSLCNGTEKTLTKYNSENDYGVVDNKTVLDLEDDVAHHSLKGDWRIPSSKEWEELANPDNCVWTWTTQNEISGYLVTSKRTDNYIFIPAAGHKHIDNYSQINTIGYYWLNELPNPKDPDWTTFNYHSSYALTGTVRSNRIDVHGYSRYSGQSVRPVLDNVVRYVSCDDHLSLCEGYDRKLSVTAIDGYGTGLVYFSKDESIATVDNTGNVHAVSAGSTTIRVTTSDGSYSVYCSITVLPSPEIIDLGLSVKWASYNLGATTPEEVGYIFAWGETEPKSNNFSWQTYKWCNGSKNSLTKYNSNSEFGAVDNKSVLDEEDDAAHVLYGGSWRMPTREEANELYTYCEMAVNYTDKIVTFTSTINGNAIVFPLSPSAYRDFAVWTKSLSRYSYTPDNAAILSTTSFDNDCSETSRIAICNIRAVLAE